MALCLQGRHVPRAFRIGRTFDGALVFLATEDCGEPLKAAELTAQVCSQAMAAVHAMHRLGVQHCDLALHNFLQGFGRVILCDLSMLLAQRPPTPFWKQRPILPEVSFPAQRLPERQTSGEIGL